MEAAVMNGGGNEIPQGEITSGSLVEPRQPLAIVRRFRPIVNIRESQEPEWTEARLAHELFDRDTLRTGDDGYAVVQMIDNSLVRVRPNSMLIIRGETNDRGGVNSRINVERGGLNLSVSGRQSDYEVQSGNAVAAVKGTQFSAVLNPDGSATFVCFTGEIAVIALNTGQEITLTPRRRAQVDAEGNTVQVRRVTRRTMRSLEQEEARLEEASRPSIMRIQFRNAEGEEREIDIQYFDVESEENEQN